MNLIIGIAITAIFYIVAADAIKKHPGVFYIGIYVWCGAVVMYFNLGYDQKFPEWFNEYFMKIFSRDNKKSYECKKEILKRIIAINMIITSLFCYLPINSFAADADDDEKDEMMEAIVPYAANSIISKFVNINNLSMRQ